MMKSRMRLAWHTARVGKKWDAYRVLVGKQERNRPLGRPRRWKDTIELVVMEAGCAGLDWTLLVQGRRQ
jgi:hypothetical protein